MLDNLPPELISKIIIELYKCDKRSFGNLCLVCKDWNLLFSQSFIWLSIAMEFHPDFLSSFQDYMNLAETLKDWKMLKNKEEKEEKKEEKEEKKKELSIIWKDKVTEWEMIDELLAISPFFFEEPYERRLTVTDIVTIICESKLISITTILEFIPSARSDLKVAGGIGLKTKFLQICEVYPHYLNKILLDYQKKITNENPVEKYPITLTENSVIILQIATKTAGLDPALDPIIEGLELAHLASQTGEYKGITFPPLFQRLIDYILLILDDRSSRVSYRAIECISVLRPLCFLLKPKLETLKDHYNAAVNGLAEEICKSLRKPSFKTKLISKFK